MHTGKKQALSFLTALLFVVGILTSPATATMQPQASAYINSYVATVSAVGGGKVSVKVQVQAKSFMSEIGATNIRIEQSINNEAWTIAATYSSDSVAAMLSSGTIYNKTPVTYQGTSGYQYRAVVTCYAANAAGSDSKVYVTPTVIAK